MATATQKSINEARKRDTDLNAQTGQPFEYADKLALLTRRQQEIFDALDLTNNQASVQLESDATEEPAAVDADGDSLRGEYVDEWL